MNIVGSSAISILFVVFVVIKVVLTHPQNCSYDPGDGSVACKASSLELTSSSYQKSTKIDIQCSDTLSPISLRANHFGYLPTLSDLKIRECDVRSVPALAFSGLSGLTSLDLVQTSCSEVKRDAFTGLDVLQRLNLSRNHLWTLPDTVLCGLESLTSLDLSGNELHDVFDLGFSEAEVSSCRLPVESLDLSENEFDKIPSMAFSQVSKLERLDVSRNKINVIQDNAFENLRNLKNLNLADNELIALPPDVFLPTPIVREIYLQNNSLTVLAPGIFEGLEHLLVLNISRNQIGDEWLSKETFQSLIRLVALDLSHNRIQKLIGPIFQSLTSLQILNLSHNRLKTLDSGTFASQNNLHILRLSYNGLETVRPGALNGLTVVNSISLDNNRLRSLDQTTFHNCCSILAELDLSYNRLASVPDGLNNDLQLLKSLDLSGNSISIMSNGSFSGLRSLDKLTLSSNGIKSINENVFTDIPSVRMLDLANNNIEELKQGVFNALEGLAILRLDGNRLTDINGLLSGQTKLRRLNVSNNELQWFDYAFIPKELQWLDIHGNQIEELGNYYGLTDDFELTNLDASNNQIVKLEPLSLPKSIRTLNLSRNRISVVAKGTLSGKTLLSVVDMSHNRIEKLSMDALTIDDVVHTNGLRSKLFLRNNPLLCDCEMDWLKKINEMTQLRLPKVSDLSELECRLGDSSTTPQRIADIPKDGFLCRYEAHCFALCMCCDFFACDCRMQCPEGCNCFHDSTWSSNVIQCSRKNREDIPPLIPTDATDIYMDGNNFTGILDSQSFIGRKRIMSLFLNNSQIEGINNQTFIGLNELELLHLEDNLIRRLEGYEFTNLTSVKNLFLQRNRLNFIHELTFISMVSLEYLRLDGNRLSFFPVWNLGSLPRFEALTLAENPWTCKCEFVQKFREFSADFDTDLRRVHCLTDDLIYVDIGGNVSCSGAMAMVTTTSTTTSKNNKWWNTILPIIIVATAAVLIAIFTFAVTLFVFRTPLGVWLHSRYGIRIMDRKSYASGRRRRDAIYDAFVGYSIKDEDFVTQILLPELERSDRSGYKLCLQHRDLPKNSSFSPETFPGVARLCSSHILVVSKTFLESEWLRIQYSMPNDKWRPILLIIEDSVDDDISANSEFRHFIKMCPLIRWSETGFWNKLRFYLPDTVNLAEKTNLMFDQKQQHQQQQQQQPRKQESIWHYDGLLRMHSVSNNSSSTSTRSTVTGSGGMGGSGGSPRTMIMNETPIQVLNNPLETYHTYQSIRGEDDDNGHLSHIYHTLEPSSSDRLQMIINEAGNQDAEQRYDALGNLDVMLPNGQMVPATLVRNSSGRIVPLLEVGRTLPSRILPVSSTSSASTSPTSSFSSPHQNNKHVVRGTPRTSGRRKNFV